jgi:hypothetical protein
VGVPVAVLGQIDAPADMIGTRPAFGSENARPNRYEAALWRLAVQTMFVLRIRHKWPV